MLRPITLWIQCDQPVSDDNLIEGRCDVVDRSGGVQLNREIKQGLVVELVSNDGDLRWVCGPGGDSHRYPFKFSKVSDHGPAGMACGV